MARIHDVAQMIKLVFTIFVILFVIDNKMGENFTLLGAHKLIAISTRGVHIGVEM